MRTIKFTLFLIVTGAGLDALLYSSTLTDLTLIEFIGVSGFSACVLVAGLYGMNHQLNGEKK